MNPVVHFEMPAEDKTRMVEFYTKVFGWQITQLGPEMGNYVLVETSETEESGFPKEPGRINGGFTEKSQDNQTTTIVITVDNIHNAMKKVTAAGGTVLGGHQKPGEPDDIPGVGLYTSFIDKERFPCHHTTPLNASCLKTGMPVMDVSPFVRLL